MADPGDFVVIDPRVVPPPAGAIRAAAVRAQDEDTVGTVREVKERNASHIALIITWTFTGATAVCLLGICLVLGLERQDPAAAKTLLEAGVPAFKEVCIALTSLFGPLLAFVLGYYFGERNRQS